MNDFDRITMQLMCNAMDNEPECKTWTPEQWADDMIYLDAYLHLVNPLPTRDEIINSIGRIDRRTVKN